MIRPGLCSVTLRALPVEAVAEVAARAGLEAIEWGGDVHVPPGDVEAARAARAAAEGAGLRVASYGSYYRAGADEPAAFTAVLESARALGAPRIRVWAGATPSARADSATRAAVAGAAREAAANGIEIAFEFHKGTLNDDVDSALALLGASGVVTYWQPPEGMPDDEAIEGLQRLLPHVRAVHVFSWWPRNERLPLAGREALWRRVLALLPSGDALLEFVPGDDPALVAGEARTLRRLIEEARAAAA